MASLTTILVNQGPKGRHPPKVLIFSYALANALWTTSSARGRSRQIRYAARTALTW